jgi:carbamoyl-phosphate synthase large subunit
MTTVLVTAAGAFDTPGIVNALKHNDEGRVIRVVCADIKELIPAGIIYGHSYRVPVAKDDNYVGEILRICMKEEVDVICPFHTDELLALARNRDLFEEHNVKVAVADESAIRSCIDKAEAYEILKNNGLPVPDYFMVRNRSEFSAALEALGYPRVSVCFKPAQHPHGGARGFRIIARDVKEIELFEKPTGILELDTVMRALPDQFNLLVMEYLSGVEYSNYAFADRHQEMLYCIPNKRERLMEGYSFEAVTEEKPELCRLVEKIIKVFHLSFNVNVQIRYSADGEPKIVEVNPRMGGTIALPVAAGVNLPYYAVKLALGEPVPRNVPVRWGTRMLRYWAEAFA